MAKNENLHKAKAAKNDEFYTQISDIENELKHYKKHFQGAVVFCNCDDPGWSNFWKYFYLNFEALGLKKLISTHYNAGAPTYKIEYDGTGEPVITPLAGDGDFRSPECVELLKQADIIATNPPFSLFREYVAQLVKYDKKFIIIGNQNAITYKEIFPLIKDNKIWIGCERPYEFNTPDGTSTKKVGGLCKWFTNLDIAKRHETVDFNEHYTPEKYPKYDNYDAINVNKTCDIPGDYDGCMGVPITYLDRYNPDQFDIIKFRKGDDEKDLRINGKCPYFRILIKRK